MPSPSGSRRSSMQTSGVGSRLSRASASEPPCAWRIRAVRAVLRAAPGSTGRRRRREHWACRPPPGHVVVRIFIECAPRSSLGFAVPSVGRILRLCSVVGRVHASGLARSRRSPRFPIKAISPDDPGAFRQRLRGFAFAAGARCKIDVLPRIGRGDEEWRGSGGPRPSFPISCGRGARSAAASLRASARAGRLHARRRCPNVEQPLVRALASIPAVAFGAAPLETNGAASTGGCRARR